MRFAERLEQMNACGEAVDWVGRKGIQSAWRDCERGDWMLWLLGRMDVDRKVLVAIACDCAERALKHVPDGENRPAEAIRVTRLWLDGKASLDDVRVAGAAALDAARDAAWAAWAAARDAALAAWGAALAARDTVRAALAARDTVRAAGAAADAERKAQADIIRKYITPEDAAIMWREVVL